MAFLDEKNREIVKKEFEKLANPVTIVNFTQQLECRYCEDTRKLMEELAQLSDKISLEVYNFQIDKEKAEEYGVDKIPATVIVGEKDFGVRYYGIPGGYEFTSVVADIIDVSIGDSGLSEETKSKLAGLEKDIHLQVFVTPTCPYCPGAVQLAHKFAIESPKVTADMVEATEFPHLSIKYNVRGVPRTIINEEFSVEGAVPEDVLIEKILEAVK